jgi:hypothetical protein
VVAKRARTYRIAARYLDQPSLSPFAVEFAVEKFVPTLRLQLGRFSIEIDFDRLDLVAISSKKFGVAERFPAIGLQVVKDKGFVSLIEELANVDRLGVFAVVPTTIQVCGTIDMIIVRAGEGEVVAQSRFES